MTQQSIGPLYGRSYEVQIATGTAPKPNAQTLTYKNAIVYGNYKGRRSPIRMNFDVHQKGNDEVKAQLQILNLPPSVRNNIKQNSIVRLYAGYPTQYGLLVAGYVSDSVSKRVGADIVTTIKTQSTPGEIDYGVFIKTYKGLVTTSQVLHDIQKNALLRLNAGGQSTVVALQRGAYEGLLDVSYANGLTFNCTTKEAIEKLLGAEYQVSLNAAGELCITRAGSQQQDYKRVAVVLNEQTGLIGSPSLKYSDSVQSGKGSIVATGSVITFVSLLNPRLRVNGYCRVTYQGKQYDCRIQNAKFTGSTDDGPWQVECIATVIQDITALVGSGLTLLDTDEGDASGNEQVGDDAEGAAE